jgi:hypothetical protein
LSLPIGSLIEPPEHEVVPLQDAPLINLGGSHAVERLLSPLSEARLQLLRVLSTRAPPEARIYTINCVEAWHVLRNSPTLRFPTQTINLSPGDTVTLAGRL